MPIITRWRIVRYALFLLLGLLLLQTRSQADIIPNVSSITPNGSNFTWTYDVILTNDQRLVSGNYFTIYDFQGFVPGTNFQPANWVFSSADTGVTPSGLSVFDDPTIPNLTWTYVGLNIGPGPLDLGLFGADSTLSDVDEIVGNFAAEAIKYAPGKPGNGNLVDNVGSVSVPGISTFYISSLDPDHAPAGGPDFTLTVNGAGFMDGSVVDWNGIDLTTQYGDDTQLTATVPAAYIASPGTADITVINPDGSVTDPATFTVDALSLTSLSPDNTPAGGADFTLTLNGAGFVDGATITWTSSGTPTTLAATLVSDSQMTATVPASLIATPGTAGVMVTNPDGSTSNALTFTITNPAPTTTGLSPSSIGAGSSQFTLTVYGTNFVNTSTVNWNGSPLTTTYVSATQLTATIPASLIANPGTASITVTTPGPGGGASGALTFTINYAVTTNGLSPSSTPAAGATFKMIVTGSGYASGAVVQWTAGGTTTNLTTKFNSSTQVTATVPSTLIASPGTASVTVVSGGQPSNPATFTITNPTPVLTSLTPSSKDAGGPAFTLIVKGKKFLSSSVVNWNGSPLTTTYVSATELTASVPASDIASPGAASVTVTTPGPGGGTSSALPFTILVTTLKVSARLTVDITTGDYIAVLSIKNAGYMTASGVSIISSTLGGAATSTPLPVSVGDIAPGATVKVTLTYPASAGTAGTTVSLSVVGAFTGENFSNSLKVKLP